MKYFIILNKKLNLSITYSNISLHNSCYLFILYDGYYFQVDLLIFTLF